MKRDKKIEIRLTEDEFNQLENMSKAHSMTKSEFIRHALLNRNTSTPKEVAHILCNMQTEVNRLSQLETQEDSLNNLNDGMAKLWQYLY